MRLFITIWISFLFPFFHVMVKSWGCVEISLEILHEVASLFTKWLNQHFNLKQIMGFIILSPLIHFCLWHINVDLLIIMHIVAKTIGRCQHQSLGRLMLGVNHKWFKTWFEIILNTFTKYLNGFVCLPSAERPCQREEGACHENQQAG